VIVTFTGFGSIGPYLGQMRACVLEYDENWFVVPDNGILNK